VDFLIKNIEIALKLNKVEINPIYRFKTIIPIFQMAKEMEREQIEEVAMYHRDSAVEIDCIRSYMKKNYGGEDE
jgi:hypothetical protein